LSLSGAFVFHKHILFLMPPYQRIGSIVFGLSICLSVCKTFNIGQIFWMVSDDKAFIFQRRQRFYIGTLIFDLITLTLEFDNNGHLLNVPLIGAFVFHNTSYSNCTTNSALGGAFMSYGHVSCSISLFWLSCVPCLL
jgi:hypothetical protein